MGRVEPLMTRRNSTSNYSVCVSFVYSLQINYENGWCLLLQVFICVLIKINVLIISTQIEIYKLIIIMIEFFI